MQKTLSCCIVCLPRRSRERAGRVCRGGGASVRGRNGGRAGGAARVNVLRGSKADGRASENLVMLDDVAHAKELARRECWARAHTAYTRALCRGQSSSRHEKAHLYAERGRCCLRRGQPGSALRDFDAAIHLAPDVAMHWQLRSQARRRLGEEYLALEDGVVSARLDAERLSCIFSQLLPPVDRPLSRPTRVGESKRRSTPHRRRTVRRTRAVLPRNDRGLLVPKKSPEQLFEQLRPELHAAASSYAGREAERHRDAVRAQRQAEELEQERMRQEAKAVADAEAREKLRVLHRQYIELELAKVRSQLQQLVAHTSTLGQRIANIDETLERGEHARAVLEEEVRVIDNASLSLQRSKRATMKREEFELATQAVNTNVQSRQKLLQLQHQAVQQQDDLRATVQKLRDDLNQLQ